jgi:hypothetical protein
MDTPSLRSDSPKTRVYSVSLVPTPTELSTPKVATGSMEEMRAPNKRESKSGIFVIEVAPEIIYTIIPIAPELRTVPITAYMRIGKKSLRKAFLSMLRAHSKTMGGSKIRRKRLLSNENVVKSTVQEGGGGVQINKTIKIQD